MDFNFFFRRFFNGSSGSMRDPFFEADADEKYERRNPKKQDEFFESFEQHIDMFQHMEDMFNHMFRSSFGMLNFPNLDENIRKEQSPRSIMLKESEDNPCGSSLCKKEGEKDLSSFLEKGRETAEKSFSFSKFSSIKTVRLPDGTIEEHKTVIDNDGNKTTTVRRTIDDTSHEVVMKYDKQGLKEKEENFMNIDENDLSSFEEKWNKFGAENPVESPAPSLSLPESSPSLSLPESSPSLGLPESSPSYWYLLKKFFGPSQKDEVKWC